MSRSMCDSAKKGIVSTMPDPIQRAGGRPEKT